jgi:hypothetical protein
VLRNILGPKTDEVTWELRRLHSEEHYDLYSSPNIIRVIEPRKLRWVGHVARMGHRRSSYRVLTRNLRKMGHLENLSVDGRIISE